ncbi:MAG: hypothetical protein QM796_02995 [Chthoniobacteraceae bacterium]
MNENAERLRVDQELRECAVIEQEQAVAEQRLELEEMEERLTAARQNVNELRNRISQGREQAGLQRRAPRGICRTGRPLRHATSRLARKNWACSRRRSRAPIWS